MPRNAKRLLYGLLMAAVFSTVAGVLVAYVDDSNIFELDGNAVSTTGVDWDDLYLYQGGGAKPANLLTFSKVVNDGIVAGDTILSGGSTKDTEDISKWLWKRTATTSVQDKDDIEHAYAAAFTNPTPDSNGVNHTIIYFGADRYSNAGASVIGFWFFQNPLVGTGVTATGNTSGNGDPFVGTHVNNDLLIVADFTKGGAVPQITLYEWQNGLVPVTPTAGALCVSVAGGTQDKCAITNASDGEVSPWPFIDKDGKTTFSNGEFFEGGVDLNVIFKGAIPCFSRFMAETRSSPSPTSTLSDFVIGEFPLCGISLTKDCGTGIYEPKLVENGTKVQYTFTGTVTNTGVGTLTNVRVLDTINPGTAQAATATITELYDNLGNPITSLMGNQTGFWRHQVTAAALSLNNSAIAKGDYGTMTFTSDADTATCNIDVKGAVGIDKTCSTSLEVVGTNVVVKVGFSGKVTNNGSTRLWGLALSDNPAVSGSITLNYPTGKTYLDPGDQATYSGSYYPSAISSGDGTTPGRYFFNDVIKVTSVTAALGTVPYTTNTTLCGSNVYACYEASCPICPPNLCVTAPEPTAAAATNSPQLLRPPSAATKKPR